MLYSLSLLTLLASSFVLSAAKPRSRVVVARENSPGQFTVENHSQGWYNDVEDRQNKLQIISKESLNTSAPLPPPTFVSGFSETDQARYNIFYVFCNEIQHSDPIFLAFKNAKVPLIDSNYLSNLTVLASTLNCTDPAARNLSQPEAWLSDRIYWRIAAGLLLLVAAAAIAVYFLLIVPRDD